MINPGLPTETEGSDDPDTQASELLTSRLGGYTVERITVCAGDDEHAAHIQVLLVGGLSLEIIDNDGAFLIGISGHIDRINAVSTSRH